MTHKLPLTHTAPSWSKLGAATLLAVFLLLPAYAQQTTGSLKVTVTDANGAAVAGANVTVKNQDTGQIIGTATTNQDGEAVVPALPPGRYIVSASVQGFAAVEQTDVVVQFSQSATVSIQLTPGFEKNTIDIGNTANRGALDAAEPRQELSALPNLNNDLTPVLQIVPGAVATGPSSLGRVIVDGKGSDQQTARLDGVDFTSQVDLPSADSAISGVGSFQTPEVAGNLDRVAARSGAFGYEPRHGPGSGVVTETPTYSGPGSDWKLQLYGNLRNDALSARNFFDYDGKNGLRRARFGGKFGTAIGSRASLFLAYDGWRGRVERNVYEAVPADAATGGVPGPLGQLLRDFLPTGTTVVPGNSSLNPDFVVARRRTRTTAESNAFDVRFDYFPYRLKAGDLCPKREETDGPKAPRQCSPFTVRFTHQTADNDVPDGVTGRRQLQEFNFTNILVGFRYVTRTKRFRSEIPLKSTDKEFGHNFRFGFNRTQARMTTALPPSTGFDLSQSLISISGTVNTEGLPIAAPPDGQPATIPVATLGGLAAGSSRGLDLKPTSYSFLYDYSRIVSENKMHELYAGGEARFIRLDYDRLGGLTYSFPSVAALRAGTPGSVTFLSDLSAQGPFSQGAGRRQARQEFYMGYFQMVSQFRRSLSEDREPLVTLTYGVRYDHFGGVRERDNRAAVVDPLTGRMLGADAPFYRVDHANIQPRFGLAYRLSDGGTFSHTVLRAGVGLYSSVPRIGDLLLPIDSDRFSAGINGGAFPASPADLVRFFVDNPQTRLYQPVAFARDFSPLERLFKWDAKLTQSVNGYDFSVYYIGNIGRNLALANFANRIVGVATNSDPTKPAIVTREFGDGFGEFQYRRGGGHSSYNALTLQLARDSDDMRNTPKRWLKIPVSNFNAKYTLSRSVGNVSGTLMSNPLDPDADFGDNVGVARHSFTLSAAYDLWQLSRNRNPTNRYLGWKIMPVLKVTSGLPLVVRVQRPDVVYVDGAGNLFSSPAVGRAAVLNTLGGGGAAGAYVPNLVPSVTPYVGGFADRLFLDPAAFSIPAPGTLGNVRRGQFKGPRVVQLDLGLRRNFFNNDKALVEFQVDIYNVFNHANFSNPAASLPNALGTSDADNQIQPGVPFRRAGAGAFGFVTSADQGRLIQFSLTLKLNSGFTK
jgi:Carboxypeptidase regulatory-like domain